MADDVPVPPAPPAPQPTTEGTAGALKLVPLVIVGLVLGVWVMRPASPSARVEADLARAAAAIDAGQWLEAAPILERIAGDRSTESPLRKRASDALGTIARRALEEKRPLKEAATLLGAEIRAEELAAADVVGITSATLVRALDRAQAELATDPKGAFELASHVLHCVEGSDLEARAKEARTKALEASIARDPKDVEALAGLAAIDYAEERIEEARKRLEPVADKLGTGEGARILGLSRLKGGRLDESVAFLSSYYEANLAAFERATQGFAATCESVIHNAELEPALAKRYRDAGGNDERKRAHDEFVGAALRSDPGVRAAKQAVAGVSPLLDVALALAQIEIVAARGKTEGERATHLDRANVYLKSIDQLGSQLDAWWFCVARLKSELGKTADVEIVVDGYLSQFGRSPARLLVASRILAEAGDLEPARARAEEAFSAARVPEERELAAQLRSRIATSREDQLSWLQRAGSRPEVITLEKQARANLALDEGRFDEAAAGFDEALKLDTVGGASQASFRTALLALMKSRATGSSADLDAAIATLVKCTSSEPPPLAALAALADALQERAVASVVGDRIRTDVLHDRGLDLLDLGALDENEARALAATLAANADMKRSLAVREHAIAEAPPRLQPYGALLAWVTKGRDPGALDAFATRIEKAGLDRVEESRELAAYWSGKDDEGRLRRLGARRKRADAVVSLARTAGHARTTAVALAARASLEKVNALHEVADHELAVKLDEEALALAPTFVIRLALRNALLSRAGERARVSSPRFEALVQTYGKIGLVTVLGWAVRADSSLAARLSLDHDVKRALELHADALGTEREAMPHDWLVFAIAGDARADEAAKHVAGSRLALAQATAACAVSPTDPELVNDLAIVLELRGEKDARAKLLAEAKKAGVLLPYELLEK